MMISTATAVYALVVCFLLGSAVGIIITGILSGTDDKCEDCELLKQIDEYPEGE